MKPWKIYVTKMQNLFKNRNERNITYIADQVTYYEVSQNSPCVKLAKDGYFNNKIFLVR